MSKYLLLLLLVVAVFVLPACVSQSPDRTLAGHFFEDMVYLRNATSARESLGLLPQLKKTVQTEPTKPTP